ncbi:MAG TPA: hypothetical protein VK481_05755 [Gemmatimonadaceae bacterium]|nr:hypothetical protein [Gemmatimonadaceae bacterium]
MSRVTLSIPMIAAVSPVESRQISRDFQGALPAVEAVAFLASIIRDGLESAHYPEYQRLNELSDDYLVSQTALVSAVPDHVWIRNGFVPLGEWRTGH